MYSPKYGTSRALLIGINKYAFINPLMTAVSDANGVAQILIDNLGFAKSNVTLLTDAEASRDSIMSAYHAYTQNGTDADDRLFIFFAGHGHTVPSLRSSVGYLIPADGRVEDLGSLIRWDELTRNSDLIRAKHVLFVMDACYGGLAVTRSVMPGSVRFLTDMMSRVARQVLTSGKSDETVSDGGGPLPNHSVFTGHLIEALSGKALDNGGNLTANGINAYVYAAVARDTSSLQTPHYGYLHGEGDFIFAPLNLQADDSDLEQSMSERLIDVPALIQGDSPIDTKDIDRLKELLSEERYRIQLRDFVVKGTRDLLARTGEDSFPVHSSVTNDVVTERIQEYETESNRMMGYEMLLGYWASVNQLDAAMLPFVRLSERLGLQAGDVNLNNLRWYPMMLLFYSFGIGAVAANRYGSLASIFQLSIFDHNSGKSSPLVKALTDPLTESYDLFRLASGGVNKRVPRSEHLYKVLQPQTDDLLFLGRDYETQFDRFELFYGLQYAYQYESWAGYIWGPIGRFSRKFMGFSNDPITPLVEQASTAGASWEPLAQGLFGGDLQKFLETAEGFRKTIKSAARSL